MLQQTRDRSRAGGAGGAAAGASTVLLAIALLAFLLPGIGRAAGPSRPQRVAVLGFEGNDLPAKLPAQVTTAVRAQISTFPDLILVAKDAVSLSEAALTFSCIDESAACMAQIGKELGAQILLYGRLKSNKQHQVHLVLHAIDVEEGRPLGTEEGIFEPKQAEEGAARLCAQLLTRQIGTAKQAHLALNILQAGARIYLDGGLVEQAPLSAPLMAEPGLHELKVAHEGFEDYREMVDVHPGEMVRREIDLKALSEEYPPPAPLPAEAIAPPPSGKAWGMRVNTARLVGWGLLGGGALIAAVGGTFSVLTLQTQQQFNDTRYQRQAKELKETGESYALTARVLYGVGGALALSGAILLLSSGTQGSQPAGGGRRAGLSVQPLLDPSARTPLVGAMVLGSF